MTSFKKEGFVVGCRAVPYNATVLWVFEGSDAGVTSKDRENSYKLFLYFLYIHVQ